MVRSSPVTAELLDLAPRLRVVGRHGVGLDNVDLAAAHERGIAVVNTPGTNAASVAELNNVREALAIARECRTILGASGITTEYSPLRHANNLESVLTYEGTSEVHQLILGRAMTGAQRLRPAAGLTHRQGISTGRGRGLPGRSVVSLR